MRVFLLGLMFLGVTTQAQAQCVAEVKDVVLDTKRGSIVVETQYSLNGVVVDTKANPCPTCTGKTRYTEETGTIAKIVTKAKADVQQHCENLIIRNAVSVNNLNEERLNIQKSLTEPLVTNLKARAVGWKKTVTQKLIKYKNKEITVNADGTYTVSNIITQ